MEGSTVTPDETASIYDTGTILTSRDKVISLKGAAASDMDLLLNWYNKIKIKKLEDIIEFHADLKKFTHLKMKMVALEE